VPCHTRRVLRERARRGELGHVARQEAGNSPLPPSLPSYLHPSLSRALSLARSLHYALSICQRMLSRSLSPPMHAKRERGREGGRERGREGGRERERERERALAAARKIKPLRLASRLPPLPPVPSTRSPALHIVYRRRHVPLFVSLIRAIRP